MPTKLWGFLSKSVGTLLTQVQIKQVNFVNLALVNLVRKVIALGGQTKRNVRRETLNVKTRGHRNRGGLRSFNGAIALVGR
ncbi:MAG: hypothetical protein ACTS41_01795 [Candidatus Hodgkinia cicadicola]